jgi:type II secretory pathway pseudopilin PulG
MFLSGKNNRLMFGGKKPFFGTNRFSGRSQAGALLLEALLAIVILSVALVSVVQSMAMSAKALNQSLRYSEALSLLENQLFEFTRDPLASWLAFEKKSFDPPYQDYQYQYRLSEVRGDDSAALKILEIDVLWGTEGRQGRVPLTTYLLSKDAGDEG